MDAFFVFTAKPKPFVPLSSSVQLEPGMTTFFAEFSENSVSYIVSKTVPC